MDYEVEYEKTYDGKTLTARPVKGDPSLPVLTIDVDPERVKDVIAAHRVRTIDPTHPGVGAYLFGLPGNIRVVHHDGEVITVDSPEAAFVHVRSGEWDTIQNAYVHYQQADQRPKSAPIVGG